jgi:hypothetical protein
MRSYTEGLIRDYIRKQFKLIAEDFYQMSL